LAFRTSSRAGRAAGALLSGLALTLAACQQRDTVLLDAPLSATDGLDDRGAPADAPAPPDTAAGRQLSWLLQVINERVDELAPKEIRRHFEDVFLRVVSSEDILAQFSLLSKEQAPLTFLEVSPDTSDMSLLALIAGNRAKLTIGMNIEPGSGKISGLQLTPVAEPVPATAASWQGVDQSLSGLAPRAQYLVARVDGGSCESLHAHASGERLALGSSSSLYVLAELARQIEAGSVRWDTPVVIQDALKSLPSGELQNLAAGTRISVQDVADKMIAISDNTAADHLIDLLGRENIEAGQAAAGHLAPELNVPFLATRELFLFRLELAAAQTELYLAQTVGDRRAFLSDLAGRAPRLERAADWFLPRRIEQLEWFASSEDLCRLMLSLQQRSQLPGGGPLREVLSQDPGLPIDAQAFPYIAFKGGSEPGVLNLTWLVERRDGAQFFVSIGLNDPSAPILDTDSVLQSALDIFELLADAN
jgi:beta-lactamase class A